MKELRQCLYCRKEFWAKNTPSRIGRGKFCCKNCANRYRQENSVSKEHWNWQGGKPRCIDCNKELEYGSKRCVKCAGNNRRGEKHPQWKQEGTLFICQECGKEYRKRPSRKSRTKYCSWKCKMKNLSLRGELANNWKGGISRYRDIIRQTPEYKNWRKQVFDRDNYICMICQKNKCYLQAHHIKKFADYPEYRTDVKNGITLCRECHNNTKGKENKYKLLFQFMINIMEKTF